MRRLFVTTGDPDGIGTEVTSKALAELGSHSNFQYVVWRSHDCPRSDLARMDRVFDRQTIYDVDQLKNLPLNRKLIDLVSEDPPARWVETSARLCLKNQAVGIVTAPLSKTGIAAAGMHDRGHTEIFSRVTKNKDLYMCFWGRQFRILLLTDHVPIAKIAKHLTPRRVENGIRTALEMRKLFGLKKPIAIVGLNPHAGETGLLGTEEKIFARALRSKLFEGPLVPDVAFMPANWPKYSVFVCCYHDQGLIPFKLIHGFDEGVHLTLGLPFVRTSVDHGTAKELFGLNKAEHGSMREAIELAMRLARGRK